MSGIMLTFLVAMRLAVGADWPGTPDRALPPAGGSRLAYELGRERDPAANSHPVREADPPVDLRIRLVNWNDMDMAEQDVFIERQPGSSEVWRVTAADRKPRQPLFGAARTVAHNPFDLSDLGPYPKGDALGLSLGEYLAARGSGRYRCAGSRADIDLGFEKLVPGGVYSLWHSFVAMPPTTPFIGTYDLPLGARDGSEAGFVADADGNARFRLEFTPCLQLSGEHLAGMLSLNWHSDGRTHGTLPGEFATASHVQLWTMLPRRGGL